MIDPNLRWDSIVGTREHWERDRSAGAGGDGEVLGAGQYSYSIGPYFEDTPLTMVNAP